MSWKNWSYWLKGGIIGSIIGIIIDLSWFFLLDKFDFIFEILNYPLLQICAEKYELSCIFLTPLIGLLYGFILGAIIGWIYGKIRKSKSLLKFSITFI